MECLNRDTRGDYECPECGSRYAVYHRYSTTTDNQDTSNGYTCSTCGSYYPITHRFETSQESAIAGQQMVKMEPLTPSRYESLAHGNSQKYKKENELKEQHVPQKGYRTEHMSDVFKRQKLPTLRVPEIQYTTDFLQDILEDSPETVTRDDVASDDNGALGNQQDIIQQIIHDAANRRYRYEDISDDEIKVDSEQLHQAVIKDSYEDIVPPLRVPTRENIDIHIDTNRDHVERRVVKVHRKQEQHQNVWMPTANTEELRTVQILRTTSQETCSSASSSMGPPSKETSNDLRQKLQMSRKRGRNSEDDMLDRDETNSQKRNRQSCEEEVSFYKNLSESLREQNSFLLQKHDTLRKDIGNLKESLSVEKYRAKKDAKYKNYRNAAMGKTLDRLREQSEKSNNRVRELENERNRLYHYAKRIEKQHMKATTRVEELKTEYKESIATKLYPRYPRDLRDKIPSWHKQCTNCDSPKLHLPTDCVARGVRCKNCNTTRHLTATCFFLADIDCKPTRGERKLLQKIAQEINNAEQ